MLDPEDEDTIEMELTPSQMACLEEAAEQAEREAGAARQEARRALVRPSAVMPATALVQARPSVVMTPTALVHARPSALTPATAVVRARLSEVVPATAIVQARPSPVVSVTAVAAAATAVWGMPAVIPHVALAPIPSSKGRRYLAIAGAAIVVAISVATAYQLGTRSQHPQPPAETAPRIIIEHAPASEAKLPEVPLPPPKAIPVRFANPFDTSEVFEFPPGTSEAEARNAVAEVLLKRAQQRQMQRPNDPSLARRS